MSVTVKQLIRHLRETCDLDMEVVVCGKRLDLDSIRQVPARKVELAEPIEVQIKEETEQELRSWDTDECPTCGEVIYKQ